MVNAAILKWARETAGLSLEDAARALDLNKVERLQSLESGEEAPSHSLLTKMSKQYRRSLLTFYLENPPRKGDRGQDFRTVTPDRTIRSDALLDALLRDVKTRQSLVKTTLEDEDPEVVKFIGSTNIKDGVAVTLQAIKRTLGITVNDFRNHKRSEDAFAFLREKAESVGIFVLLIGNLGSFHSALSVDTFRGFAIADPIAPFVVINDQDAKTAWSFTLLHEIAHLFLGATGISGSHSDTAIEKFCNEVAGEFLLPKVELNELVLDPDWDAMAFINGISNFAVARHVSKSMVAYKLYLSGAVTWQKWRLIDSKLRELWVSEKAAAKGKAKDNDSGPSFYVVRRHRLGKAILEFTNRSVNSGALSPVKAAKVLGVKPRSVQPLLADSTRFTLVGKSA